jgi:hypothetical protein
MRQTILIFLLLPIQVFCQVNLSGTVKDMETNLPVEFATVYVNNTSVGTLCDSLGRFRLANVPVSGEIVASHVGYEPQNISLKEGQNAILDIFLSPRKRELKGIDVRDKNLREKNIEHFKKSFLGDDYWGKRASVENDSVLFFGLSESIGEKLENRETGKKSARTFTVRAIGPLKIGLPLLGYELYADLVNYTELYQPNTDKYLISSLGYYYFKPDTASPLPKQNRFRKNRQKVYYNSIQHFCRSFYEKKLKENGYMVLEDFPTENQVLQKLKEFRIDSCLQYSGEELKIIGLKGKSFLIEYYDNLRGEPIDLTKGKGINYPVYSGVYFMEDTCSIRKDGTIPDNSIVFGPFIGTKRIGARLPGNYKLGE